MCVRSLSRLMTTSSSCCNTSRSLSDDPSVTELPQPLADFDDARVDADQELLTRWHVTRPTSTLLTWPARSSIALSRSIGFDPLRNDSACRAAHPEQVVRPASARRPHSQCRRPRLHDAIGIVFNIARRARISRGVVTSRMVTSVQVAAKAPQFACAARQCEMPHWRGSTGR